MKRRKFIKSMGALGATLAAPSVFNNSAFIKRASAAGIIQDANFVAPAVLPQVINIFLYGGPSELSANLTNITDINANSQNPYDAVRGDILMNMDVADATAPGQITPNGFWKDAGGLAMEDMLATSDLSIYRTINRRKDNTRAHRNSILSSQKSNLDIEMSGGVGTTLASVLFANKAQLDGSTLLNGRQLEEMVLPFVSFEGESSGFAVDSSASSVNLPLQMRGISLDTNFDNPYARSSGIGNDAAIEALVDKIAPATNSRFQKVADGFTNRKNLQSRITGLRTNNDDPTLLPVVPGTDPDSADDGAGTNRLVYPNNNRYSSRVKAAVTLAMQNPDTLYITVGGGLGGWDDHDNSIDRYETRMTQLMTVLRVAAKHIRLGSRNDINGNPLATDNIIINVHGDFGRNVNLNGSMGWDHGNNQNLFTIGGSAIRPAGALGKVVGKTERFGDSGQNRQFTRPTTDSYEAEPMSIGSTVYSYFGVQNPEVLTADADMNPAGDSIIDETVAGEPALF
ncbi:MAG: DUF1501 domain-containing protein [Gammaproteobacteria bacterium]|nr:DUF1501 domain-containing protein [Gammaproteobacteria bacterium]